MYIAKKIIDCRGFTGLLNEYKRAFIINNFDLQNLTKRDIFPKDLGFIQKIKPLKYAL